MLKSLILVLTLSFSTLSSAQSNKWSSILYSYSNGPVSPEYQFQYSINVNDNRTGKLIFTKNNSTNEYDFTFSQKNMKKLNKCLNKSKVFTVPSDEMKSENTLVGGPERNIQITKWQSPDLDAKPEVISVPSQVNDKYSNGIFTLFETIDNLIPESIWKKAKGE